MRYSSCILAALLAGGACLADPRYASLKITTQPDSAVVVPDTAAHTNLHFNDTWC